jgi:hypothetical protein
MKIYSYYDKKDFARGPFTEEEIVDLIKRGTITPHTSIYTNENSVSSYAFEHEEFANLFNDSDIASSQKERETDRGTLHTICIVLAYVLCILGSSIGLIMALIYTFNKKHDDSTHRHGKNCLIICVIMIIIKIIINIYISI